jgi:NADH:ubiquinone oxidoreductase subunit 4 (subunit M)
MREVADLHGMELAAVGLLSVAVVALGVLPSPALQLINASVANLSAAMPVRSDSISQRTGACTPCWLK